MLISVESDCRIADSFELSFVAEPWTSSYAVIASPKLKARERGITPKNVHRQNRLGVNVVLMLVG